MSPEEHKTDFRVQQLAFTAHIRDPDANPIPDGIPARRMAIYTEIFFNNINGQLSGNFPVLRQISSDAHWHALVRDFMRCHRSETPLFTEFGLEFLAYLRDEREPREDDWPFMLELAHYEYVELAVAISPEDESLLQVDANGDLLDGRPVVSAATWNLTYAWPVHQICAEFLPDALPADPTHLVVYRDRRDDVHFLQINSVTQRLLQLLKENSDYSGLDALIAIADELRHPEPDTVIEGGKALLGELRQRNVILGTRR